MSSQHCFWNIYFHEDKISLESGYLLLENTSILSDTHTLDVIISTLYKRETMLRCLRDVPKVIHLLSGGMRT